MRRLGWMAMLAVTVACGWTATADAYVYWSSKDSQAIGRANLDGTQANPTLITGTGTSWDISVQGSHLYWSNTIVSLGRGSVDGADPERDFIKRVIGLPGDTVELRNRELYINGQKSEEPYAHYLFPVGESQESTSFDVREKYGPVTVPDGHYFMMGDNRDNSQDSRYWGFLPAHYVKGRALMIYWSFETDETGAPGGGLFGGTRWSRLLHQIH